MNFRMISPASGYSPSHTALMSSPLFAAKKKKRKPKPEVSNPAANTPNPVSTTGDSSLSQPLAKLSLSSTQEDVFQKSASDPSLAPIHEFIDRVEQSEAFANSDTSVKQVTGPILQTAKKLTADPKISEAARLKEVNRAAKVLLKAGRTWNDLLQSLTAMNVPVLESKMHAWIRHLFKKQHAAAAFIYPVSLYGQDPNWQSANPVDMPGTSPEYEALHEKMNKEKSVRILATEEPSSERVASAGENASLNDLKHETYHLLQFMMGVPFKGPSREADYQAQQVSIDFIQKLRKPDSADPKEKEQADNLYEKLRTELIEEAFNEMWAPAKKYQELMKTKNDVMGEFEELEKLDPAAIEANRESLQQRFIDISSRLQNTQADLVQVQAEMERLKGTEQWKDLDTLFKLQQQQQTSFTDPAFQESYLELLKKSAASLGSDDSSQDPSLGAAIRRIARREMEVYDALIRNKDAMGIDSKYNISNLNLWIFYKLLERHSHRFDQEIFPDANS